jgi:hypothetical protein
MYTPVSRFEAEVGAAREVERRGSRAKRAVRCIVFVGCCRWSASGGLVR